MRLAVDVIDRSGDEKQFIYCRIAGVADKRGVGNAARRYSTSSSRQRGILTGSWNQGFFSAGTLMMTTLPKCGSASIHSLPLNQARTCTPLAVTAMSPGKTLFWSSWLM